MSQEVSTQVQTLGSRAGNANRLLDLLYGKPIIRGTEIATRLSLSQPTADRLINEFLRLGILQEVTGKARNRLFVFSRYFKLFLS